MQQDLSDNNLYAVILAFPQGACVSLPGGCLPGMVENTPPAPGVVNPPSCASPFTTTGPISITGGSGAGDGGKLAPLHPVVVGQDPQRRGVDIQAQVLVPLITYHYFETVRHVQLVCLSGPVIPTNPACHEHVSITCVEHTRTYTDSISAVTINLSLTAESRQWILTSLEQAYPGAHLKQDNPICRFKTLT